MVIVDIKHSDFGTRRRGNMMSSDRCVIEIAKPTEHICCGMVSGWTTQTISRRRTSKNFLCCCECHINRCPRSYVRTFNHWGRSFIAPITKCSRRTFGWARLAHSFTETNMQHRFRSKLMTPRGTMDFWPCTFQIVNQAKSMHCFNRGTTMFGESNEIKTRISFQLLTNRLGTIGTFICRDWLTEINFHLWVLTAVQIGPNDIHQATLNPKHVHSLDQRPVLRNGVSRKGGQSPPPCASIDAPLTYAASGEAKKTHTSPISVASANRPIGI